MKRCFLLLILLCSTLVMVQAQQDTALIAKLQKEMYALFPKYDYDKFMAVTEQLKAECHKAGDEHLFYKAWANQIIYTASKGEPEEAVAKAKKMKRYALNEKSEYGAYTAIHTMATVYYRMKDYERAEDMFLESINYLHKYFPGHSAAAAYIELAKIANQRAEYPLLEKYAKQAMDEPQCEPHHKLRALTYLCELYSGRNDVKNFDVCYAQRKEVLKVTEPTRMAPEVELSNLILHNRLTEAKKAAEQLGSPSRELRLARIAHREGKDSLAYVLMKEAKLKNDSISKALHADLLDEYIDQLNNEREENEAIHQHNIELLARINLLMWIVALVVIGSMGYVMWRRYRTIKNLKEKNRELQIAKEKEHAAMEREHAARLAEHEAMQREQAARLAEHEALQKEHEARLAEHEALQKEHRALQSEHDARQEAERALKVKEEFLNNITHEMRTPLNAISGFTQLLTTPGIELDEATMTEMQQHIMESTSLLTGIVDSMVTLSFYDSKLTLEREDTVYPLHLALEQMQVAQAKARQGVEVTIDYDVDEDFAIKTNQEALQKALQCLLDNAVKYTEQGSITIGVHAEGDNTIFSISDTGPGVPEDKRNSLFELFSDTGEAVKTTGMGLNICRTIARLLGGSIKYDAEHSPGSRFVLTIQNA